MTNWDKVRPTEPWEGADKTALIRKHRHRAKLREFLNVIKDVPCADCGIRYPPSVMDFDHRDPSTKEFGIGFSIGGVSKARLLAEIEKCDVVCANCHRLRTHGTGD